MVVVRLLGYYPRDECMLAAYAALTVHGAPVQRLRGGMGRGPCLRWLRLVVLRGYTSVLEHSAYTFEARCSRVCTHQLVRHRVASYTQESLRRGEAGLREAGVEAARITGRVCGDAACLAEAFEKLGLLADDDPELVAEILSAAYTLPSRGTALLKGLCMASASYYRCLAGGGGWEECRYLLPQAVRTRIVFTMNARELLEVFLPLRMCRRAHHEIRSLAWNAWLQLLEAHPGIFIHAGPRCLHQAIRSTQEPLTVADILDKGTPHHCPEGLPGAKTAECLSRALEEAGIPPDRVAEAVEKAKQRLEEA